VKKIKININFKSMNFLEEFGVDTYKNESVLLPEEQTNF